MNRYSLLLTMILIIVTVGMTACGRPCRESCDNSDECGPGLSCHSTTSYGKVCVPDECGKCFSKGDTCRWNENYEGSNLQCTFSECVP